MHAPNQLAQQLQDLRRQRELVQAAIEVLERLHSSPQSGNQNPQPQMPDIRLVRGDWILFSRAQS